MELIAKTMILVALICSQIDGRAIQLEYKYRTDDFSECSVTCGGGVRVRSVMCTDEDGVIAPNPLADCGVASRPSPLKLCSQTDCDTGNALSFASQQIGSYELLSNGSMHTVTITNIVSILNKIEITSVSEASGDEFYYEYYVLGAVLVPTKSLYTANPVAPEVEIDNGVGTVTFDKLHLLKIDMALVILSVESGNVSYSNNFVTVSSTRNRFQATTYYYITSRTQVYAFQGSKIVPGRPGGTLFINVADSVALYSESDALAKDIIDAYVIAAPPTVRTFGNGITMDMVFSNSELYIRFEFSNLFHLASSTQHETAYTPIAIGDGVLSYGNTNLEYSEVHIVSEANGYITFNKLSYKKATIQPGSVVYYNRNTAKALISFDGDLNRIIGSLKALPNHSGKPSAVSVSGNGTVSYHGIEILSLDGDTKVVDIPKENVLLFEKGVLKISPIGGNAFFEEQGIYLLAYHNFDSFGMSFGSFNPAFHTGGMVYIDTTGRAIYVNNDRTKSVIDSFLASINT